MLLLVGAALLIWAAPAYAIWSNTAASNAAFSSATLEPPTNLSLTFVCVGRNRARATLSWTPTTSSFAEGYVITAYRSSDPSNSVTYTITPASETSVSTIIDSRPPNTEYTAEMYSFGAQWTSVVVSTTGSTPSPPGCR